MRDLTTTRGLRRAAGVLCLLAAGCRAAVPLPGPATPPPADACTIAATEPRPLLSVAVDGSVDATHAPVPRTTAERLVFSQLYETLVTIDCEGRVRGALAERWAVEEDGRAFRFRLRADASFADGSTVTSHDVVRSWGANPAAAPGATRLLARVDGTGERELRVVLTRAADVSLFAAPFFAVARRDAGATWPAGTGAYRAEDAGRGAVRLAPVRAGTPGLDVRIALNDPRRALDAGTDALLTADPHVIAYARALPGYDVVPLGWDRTWLLAGRAGAPAAPPADALRSLARDVVRGDARASAAAPCTTSGTQNTTATQNRLGLSVLYASDDSAGRAIAERIVALAWPAEQAPAWLLALLPPGYASGGAPVATAVQPAAFAQAIRQGAGLAWIIATSRVTGDACIDLLLDTGPAAVAAAARTLTLTPLVETPAHAVLRTGAASVSIQGDGVIRFMPRP